MIKFKKTEPDVKTPVRSKDLPCCWELYAYRKRLLPADNDLLVNNFVYEDTTLCLNLLCGHCYHTGIIVEIPPGHIGLLLPMPDLIHRGATLAGDCIQVIRPGDNEPLSITFLSHDMARTYRGGNIDRVARLMIVPDQDTKKLPE